MRARGLAFLAVLCAGSLFASDAPTSPSTPLPRLSQPIRIDGDLSDPSWSEAAKIETFYETNVGDNVPPPVQTTGWVGYDSRFFYVAIRCEDPDPKKIRAARTSSLVRRETMTAVLRTAFPTARGLRYRRARHGVP
jgi:hypothetical protein